MKKVTALNPKNNIFNLMGEIASHPQILKESDVNIVPDDAVTKFQKLLLASLINVIQSTNYNKQINAIDITKLLSPYPKAYKEWKRNNGSKLLTHAIQSTVGYDFHKDYKIVKKYHYLRKYMHEGFDIRGVFDYDNLTDKKIGKFRKMSTDRIIDYFSTKANDIKKSYQYDQNNIQSFEIGDGIEEHIKALGKSPQVGYPFLDGYYNRLFGGMHQNRLMIRSTVTGGGKTRQALKDFCNVAFTGYYEPSQKQWISTGEPVPALFISTELNKDELQNIVLAYITGIPSRRIEYGDFTDWQNDLLQKAVKIINQAHFYFEYVEDFTSSDIENLIDQYIHQHNVKYIDFDYIQDTPRLMQELKKSYGNGLRSDQELVYLSKELKRIAEKYHVFIMSATQVNGYYADEDNMSKSRTEYTLRGGKSIADKVDYGIIITRATKTDKNAFAKSHKLNGLHPNYAHFVYKNRSGSSRVIVWTKFNFGNLHETPLVVTDYNYNPLRKIKPLAIHYN